VLVEPPRTVVIAPPDAMAPAQRAGREFDALYEAPTSCAPARWMPRPFLAGGGSMLEAAGGSCTMDAHSYH
jgi:hypothetical protein